MKKQLERLCPRCDAVMQPMDEKSFVVFLDDWNNKLKINTQPGDGHFCPECEFRETTLDAIVRLLDEGQQKYPGILPDHLKKIRQDLNLNQFDFGRLLGVSLSTVNRWENGHIRPDRHEAWLIWSMYLVPAVRQHLIEIGDQTTLINGAELMRIMASLGQEITFSDLSWLTRISHIKMRDVCSNRKKLSLTESKIVTGLSKVSFLEWYFDKLSETGHPCSVRRLFEKIPQLQVA